MHGNYNEYVVQDLTTDNDKERQEMLFERMMSCADDLTCQVELSSGDFKWVIEHKAWYVCPARPPSDTWSLSKYPTCLTHARSCITRMILMIMHGLQSIPRSE
jgi:hypothetical protein